MGHRVAISRDMGPLIGRRKAQKTRVRKISPKFSCIKFFQIRDVPTQIPGHPGHSLSKTTEKTTCIKCLSGISRRLGHGCPRNILPKNFMFRLFFFEPEKQKNTKRNLVVGMPRKCPRDGLVARPGTSGTSQPDLCSILH